jgi:hypothetical protein
MMIRFLPGSAHCADAGGDRLIVRREVNMELIRDGIGWVMKSSESERLSMELLARQHAVRLESRLEIGKDVDPPDDEPGNQWRAERLRAQAQLELMQKMATDLTPQEEAVNETAEE